MTENSDDHASEESISRRKFLATTAAATGSLVFGVNAASAEGTKAMPTKTYDWKSLESKLKGDLVHAGSPNFAEVTGQMVWNELKPDRAPDVIVRVKNNEDVIEAVNFARENGLKIAVHGGGHTWCGLAVRNGGMTIDLTALNQAEVDPVKRKAWVQPVLSNREVAKLLTEKGMAFPTGHCPTVKMSGYLLNGGLSWNLAHWGLGVKSVESYDLVTADGKLVNASATEHSDLYWAARGSGPGMFAVAVRYHLNLFPLPKKIMTSQYYYHLNDLKEVVEKTTEIGWNLPSIVELSIFMFRAPDDIKDKCKDTNGMLVMVSGVAFAETEEEGKAALLPLGDPELLKKCLKKNVCEESNFDRLSDASGASWPEHTRNLVSNTFCNGKPVDMFMVLKKSMLDCPSSKTVVVFVLSTGKKNILQPDPDVACSAEGNFYGGVWSIWDHAKDDEANQAWQVKAQDVMRSHVHGYYIGETDYVAERANVEKAYTTEKFKRLAEIRAKYDPQGVFQSFTGGLPSAKTS